MKLNTNENILFKSHLNWLSLGTIGKNYRNISRMYVTNQRIYFEFFFPRFKILEFPVEKYDRYEEFSVVIGKGIRIFYKSDTNQLEKVEINIKKKKAEILKNSLNNIKK